MTTHESRLQGTRGNRARHDGVPFREARRVQLQARPGDRCRARSSRRRDDAQSARHTFSIVSAPFENELVVATRMRDSAFKRALKALPIGSHAAIEGPFGSLTLHNDRARPAVFIAGGIGITPFMSMLRQATQDRLPQRLLLLYSNRRPEDAAFLAELQAPRAAERDLPPDRNDDAARAISAVPGTGRPGLIDEALIKRAVAGLPEAHLLRRRAARPGRGDAADLE